MPQYNSLLAKHCAEASEHIYNPTQQLNSNSLSKLWHVSRGIQKVGIYASTNHHIVAFEGTIPPVFDSSGIFALINNIKSVADWAGNAKVKLTDETPMTGKVHKGFHEQFESVQEDLAAALAIHSADKVLVTTGHSQGGAIANLGLWHLRHQLGHPVEAGYTFAAPNCGNQEFCSTIAEDVFRFEFGNDIVPHLPPVIDPPSTLPSIFNELSESLSNSGYSKCGKLRFGSPGAPGHFIEGDGEQALLVGRLHSALISSKQWLDHHSMENYKTVV